MILNIEDENSAFVNNSFVCFVLLCVDNEVATIPFENRFTVSFFEDEE